jgi:hypothetical protein
MRNIKTIKSSDGSTKLNMEGCIVDSGTTDTYLNKQVMKNSAKAWEEGDR